MRTPGRVPVCGARPGVPYFARRDRDALSGPHRVVRASVKKTSRSSDQAVITRTVQYSRLQYPGTVLYCSIYSTVLYSTTHTNTYIRYINIE